MTQGFRECSGTERRHTMYTHTDKKEYESPRAEVIAFRDDDVITTSSTGSTSDTLLPRYGSSPMQVY